MEGWSIEEELFEYYEGLRDGSGKECINVLIILGRLKIISSTSKLTKKKHVIEISKTAYIFPEW